MSGNWPGKDGGESWLLLGISVLITRLCMSTVWKAVQSTLSHLHSKPSLRLTMCLRGRETQGERERQRDKSKGERRMWGWWTLSDQDSTAWKNGLVQPCCEYLQEEIAPFARTLLYPGLASITVFFFYQEWQITSGKGVFQAYLACFLTLLDLIKKLENSLVCSLYHFLCM